MKILVSTLALCGLATLSSSVLAEDSPHSITGNLSFVSDYAFRGVSQTGEDMAMQGGFDYAHASGLYAGVWGSNVELPTGTPNQSANLEVDLYGGYAGSVGDLGYNVGLLQYYYPDANVFDTLEVYGGVTYMGFGLKLSYSASDYFGIANSDGTLYWDASYNYTFDNGIGLGLHYGYTDGEGGQFNYGDWKVGVTVPVGKFTVGLAYTDTDTSKTGPAGDGRAIVSVGTTF